MAFYHTTIPSLSDWEVPSVITDITTHSGRSHPKNANVKTEASLASKEAAMPKSRSLKPFFLWTSFLAVILVDWFYIWVVQMEPAIIINAWFVLFPIMTFFLAAFTFIASLGLLYCKKQGLFLAGIVILFGLLATAISYFFVYNYNLFLRDIFIVIILLNVGELLLLAKNAKLYQQD